jgi:hypothetical protein
MKLKLVFTSHPHPNMNCECRSERVSGTELGRSHERHLQPVFFHFFWHRNFNSKNRNFHQFYTPKQNTHTHTHTHTNPQFFCQKMKIWWKIKRDWLDCWILLTCIYYCHKIINHCFCKTTIFVTLHKSGPKLAISITQNLCPEFVVAFHKSYGKTQSWCWTINQEIYSKW